MAAKELISTIIPILQLSDSTEKALSLMQDFHLSHLPVVENNKFIGLLSENDLFDLEYETDIISGLSSVFSKAAMHQDSHYFKIIKLAVDFNLSLVPIIDDNQNYIGAVTREILVDYFAKIGSIGTPNAILEIEINNRDYSLSHISHLIESEQAKILTLYISSSPKTKNLVLTIKLNIEDASKVVATLQRFEYTVHTFQEVSYSEASLKENYDSLINYLSI